MTNTPRRQLREQRERYGDTTAKTDTVDHYEFLTWQLERLGRTGLEIAGYVAAEHLEHNR